MPEAQAEVVQAYARRMRHARKGDVTPRVLAALTMSLFDVALQTWLDTGRRQDIEKVVEDVFRSARAILASAD